MPSPPQQGTLNEIFAAMVTLEQAFFEQMNPAFNARMQVPEASILELEFPCAFRLPARFNIEDRRMGGDLPFSYVIDVVIAVGLSSNDIGPLTEEANLYILPFYQLYMANRSILATVRNITFSEGYMGDIEINNVKLYGLQLPIITNQFLTMRTALITP